jgi:hypothetical protein
MITLICVNHDNYDHQRLPGRQRQVLVLFAPLCLRSIMILPWLPQSGLLAGSSGSHSLIAKGNKLSIRSWKVLIADHINLRKSG